MTIKLIVTAGGPAEGRGVGGGAAADLAPSDAYNISNKGQ